MKKILIIEDDVLIRENLIDLLEVNDFNVFNANNGKDGLALVEKTNPDLILCDIMMDGMDGYEVKEKLLEKKKYAHIPFIFLTAKAELKEIRKGMILGADDYIVKPFHNDDLIKSINMRLDKFKDLTGLGKNDEKEPEVKIKRDKILLTINKTPTFIDVSTIKYISSYGNYTYIFRENEKKIMVRKLIKQWEEILPDNKFIRIHQSTIINIDAIEKFEKLSNRSYIIKLKNVDEILPVSQRYTTKIKEKFLF